MSTYKNGEKTYAAVYEAAKEIFFEKGYIDTSVRELSSRSGVSTSRLTYHFKSKEQLAVNICCDFFCNIHEQVKEYAIVKNDILLSDLNYICLFGKALFVKEQHVTFFNEVLPTLTFQHVFINNVIQHLNSINEKIGLEMSENDIYTSAVYFVSSYVNLMQAGRRSIFTVQQQCGNYSRLYLKLLYVPKESQTPMIVSALERTKNVKCEIRSLDDVEYFF